MAKRELTARYLFFIAGLFVNAFGISLIIKANLGSSPISSLPYTLSLKFPVTLGQFTLLLNAVLIRSDDRKLYGTRCGNQYKLSPLHVSVHIQ